MHKSMNAQKKEFEKKIQVSHLWVHGISDTDKII